MPTPEQIEAGAVILAQRLCPELGRLAEQLRPGRYRKFFHELVVALQNTQFVVRIDYDGITQAVLAAAEAVTDQASKEANANLRVAIRAGERRAIAQQLRTKANADLRDPASDAIDGYCAAIMLNLAVALEQGE